MLLLFSSLLVAKSCLSFFALALAHQVELLAAAKKEKKK